MLTNLWWCLVEAGSQVDRCTLGYPVCSHYTQCWDHRDWGHMDLVWEHICSYHKCCLVHSLGPLHTLSYSQRWCLAWGCTLADICTLGYLVCSPYTQCWDHRVMADMGQVWGHISGSDTHCHWCSLGLWCTLDHSQWWCQAWESDLAHIYILGYLKWE